VRRLFVLFKGNGTWIAVGAVRAIPNAPDPLTAGMLPCRFVSGIRRCDLPLYSRPMGIVFNKALEGRAPGRPSNRKAAQKEERKASDRQL